MHKDNKFELTNEQLAGVSGGDIVPGGLQSGESSASDGNCKKLVSLYDGLCRFHTEGEQNCNTTCQYYCNNKVY